MEAQRGLRFPKSRLSLSTAILISMVLGIAVGIFCLGVGYALSYALEKQTPIGGNIDNADLALAAGIILCGIAWIAAWAKARN